MNELAVITVSLRRILLAEARIVACDKCSDRANIPFERLLDDTAGNDQRRSYLLPEPARCPFCQSDIMENTLVELRKER